MSESSALTLLFCLRCAQPEALGARLDAIWTAMCRSMHVQDDAPAMDLVLVGHGARDAVAEAIRSVGTGRLHCRSLIHSRPCDVASAIRAAASLGVGDWIMQFGDSPHAGNEAEIASTLWRDARVRTGRLDVLHHDQRFPLLYRRTAIECLPPLMGSVRLLPDLLRLQGYRVDRLAGATVQPTLSLRSRRWWDRQSARWLRWHA